MIYGYSIRLQFPQEHSSQIDKGEATRNSQCSEKLLRLDYKATMGDSYKVMLEKAERC